jgi:uracil-DNA glycosylase
VVDSACELAQKHLCGRKTVIAIKRDILDYQQRCHGEYAESIGLPEPYTYPDGNLIRPLPPVQTRTGSLMVLGAYPSARFESRASRLHPGRQRLVPVADNLQPFGDEQYFDGVRVRTLESGAGLRKYLLSPLNLAFEACWITDLVKVFLYKPEHAASCGDVHPEFPVPVLRTHYRDLARQSLPWLQAECRLCQPRLVVTLGLEVAQAVSGEWNSVADDLLNREKSRPEATDGCPTLYLPHPDACRRSEKWRNQLRLRLPAVKSLL